MKNQDFGRLLEQRTADFAIRIIKLSISLSRSVETGVIRNQLTKSATSIGANYREANRSRSRRDFINKLKICESEASETAFWLELINRMKWADSDVVKALIEETDELLRIFIAAGKKMNQNK